MVFQKKRKWIYVVIILILLAGAGYFVWKYDYLKVIFPDKFNSSKNGINQSQQLRLSVRMVDRVNDSYISDGQYCVYDSAFNKIECQQTYGEKFTTSYLTKSSEGSAYFIIAKKRPDYLAYLNSVLLASENINDANMELRLYPTCQPELKAINDLKGTEGILSLNLSCNKGYFQKPIVCIDWSNRFIYATGQKQIAKCDIHRSIGENINYSGYWWNITSFQYNDNVKKFVNITYLQEGYYYCGDIKQDNVEINKCKTVIGKDCILEDAKTPIRHRRYANNCFSIPFSPAGWEPTQNSYLFNVSYKTFEATEKDKLTFYLMDSECLKVGFIENNPFIKCQLEVEDELGRDIGGLDINYTFYFNATK